MERTILRVLMVGCWYYPAKARIFQCRPRGCIVVNPNDCNQPGYKTAKSSWLLNAYVTAGHSTKAIPTMRGEFRRRSVRRPCLSYDSLTVLRGMESMRAYRRRSSSSWSRRVHASSVAPCRRVPATGPRTHRLAHQRVCKCSEDAAHGLVLNCQDCRLSNYQQ